MCHMKGQVVHVMLMLQLHTYFMSVCLMAQSHSSVLLKVSLCALKKLPTKLSRATGHLFVSLANIGFITSLVN